MQERIEKLILDEETVKGRHQWNGEDARRSFLLKTTLKATFVESLSA